MKRIKKISRRMLSFIMVLVLVTSLVTSLSSKLVKAENYVTVESKSGYFYVTIVDDTTGKSDKIKVNVNLAGTFTGKNKNCTTAKTTVSATLDGNRGGNFNLNVNNSNTKKGLYYTQNNNYAIAAIGLSFTVPEHTSYQWTEVDNPSGKCSVHNSISGVQTKPVYANFDTHETTGKNKNFIAAVNLMNMGINRSEGTKHINIIIHIARNRYSVKYYLDGGHFASD